MIFTINFWSFVLSALAFFTAIYAIFYTHIQNRTLLLIYNGFYDKREQDPFMVCFTIKNLSSKPIQLNNLTMRDENNEELTWIKGFTPTQTYSHFTQPYPHSIRDIIGSYWHDSPLDKIEYLQPNSDIDLKYYVQTEPSNYIYVILDFETFGLSKKGKTKKLSVVLVNQKDK
ncbi:hypothetical protein [Brochothrix thermosphacta]|uniref:hypothetical protein n=1 Tax=Brochothrix thermosphacta TaxID=2756 RepID=UPI0039B0E58E